MPDTPEFGHFGHIAGLPHLVQTGGGRLHRYTFRFAVVDARSENAAKRIQAAFRRTGS